MKSIHTKKLFAEALKKSLKTKPITNVTIKSITDECSMNRQSFYYHFSDINQLLEWLLLQEISPIFHQSKIANLWEEGFPLLLDYIEENKIYLLNSEVQLSTNNFGNIFYEFYYQLGKEHIAQIYEGIKMSEREKNMLSQYYVLAIGQYVDAWVKGFIDIEKDEIVLFLTEIMNDHMIGRKNRANS